MHFFPLELGRINRPALFVLMADSDYAKHTELIGYSERLAHIVFSRLTILTIAVTHLYPTGTEPKIGGLQLHESCRHRRILNPRFAFGNISRHNHSQRCFCY